MRGQNVRASLEVIDEKVKGSAYKEKVKGNTCF